MVGEGEQARHACVTGGEDAQRVGLLVGHDETSIGDLDDPFGTARVGDGGEDLAVCRQLGDDMRVQRGHPEVAGTIDGDVVGTGGDVGEIGELGL